MVKRKPDRGNITLILVWVCECERAAASPWRSWCTARTFRDHWYCSFYTPESHQASSVLVCRLHMASSQTVLVRSSSREMTNNDWGGRRLPIAYVLRSPHLSWALKWISWDNYSDWVQMNRRTGGAGTAGDIRATVMTKDTTNSDTNSRFTVCEYK